MSIGQEKEEEVAAKKPTARATCLQPNLQAPISPGASHGLPIEQSDAIN